MEHGVYIIKESFYTKFTDSTLTKSKDGNRPFYCCVQDKKNSNIYWMIPLSTNVKKAQDIIKNKSNGNMAKCIHVEITHNLMQKSSVFLIQDAFPITKEYIGRPYQINKIPFVIKYKPLIDTLEKKLSSVISLRFDGEELVQPSIDVIKIYNILVSEI